MPDKKGTVAKIRVKPDVLIKGAKQDMYFVTLEDSQLEYSGIGTCPWKRGETADFMYIVNEETPDKVYLNITSILNTPVESLKKASNLTPDERKLDRLIMALGGAKVSVSIDKTISERAFEPKKYGVFITLPIGEATTLDIARKVHELMNMAEVEIACRINGKLQNKPQDAPSHQASDTPTKPYNAENTPNSAKNNEIKGFQDNYSSSVPGQKSLTPKFEPEKKDKAYCMICESPMERVKIRNQDYWECPKCGEKEPI